MVNLKDLTKKSKVVVKEAILEFYNDELEILKENLEMEDFTNATRTSCKMAAAIQILTELELIDVSEHEQLTKQLHN